MQKISALRPNVTSGQAILALQPSGITGMAKDLLSGPVRMLADAYVPFQLFSADIRNGGKRDEKWLALDSVEGSLDMYGFDGPVAGDLLMQIESRNVLPARLAAGPAADIVKEKLQRMIFRLGFFRTRNLRIDVVPAGLEFHVPYWLAFRGHGEHAQVSVLDAVRRKLEGAKARQLFRSWLLSSPQSSFDREFAPIK
jgi:hypothetical protein